ncbi:guanylate kinase [Saccharibacillus alkalitolerans]|uniref:Guanylate kinase n=1 Tax=Saccharibacillus alkalitolerans TaxID=2705290 RepID=A0ABX0F6D0_9BACL|nr:guanylate kinase [Saccharibacillus alkalitolerans]NGZ76307.1 guanylate kinase [Saccharibacillus alkalitolerans]
MNVSLVVFQGPSASGKTTLQAVLGLPRIVTWTSRAPREGEIDGVDYHFAERETLERMMREGRMLETSEYRGHLYGTSLASIEETARGGGLRSIVLDPSGARVARELLGERALLLGVSASRAECEARLLARGSDAAQIAARLAGYDEEIAALEGCDLIVRSGEGGLERAGEIVRALRPLLGAGD